MSSPTKLAPGASAEAIRAQLGEPTGRYALPGGRRAGTRAGLWRETWMLDVDADGALVAATQVLVEANFNSIKAGMTRDELLRPRPPFARGLRRLAEPDGVELPLLSPSASGSRSG